MAVSVEEVIGQLRSMGPEERLRVQAALESMGADTVDADGVGARRRAEVWKRLEWGWGTSGGRALSEGIDQALYGGEA